MNSTNFFLVSVVIGLAVAYFLKFQNERHPMSAEFLARVSQGSESSTLRMAQAVGLQLLGRNPVCDFVPGQLSGQMIVLTGANSGIGYETAKGLVRRGADLIIVGRNEKKIEEAVARLKSELTVEGVNITSIQYIISDMSDLDSVTNLIRVLHHHFGERQIDQLILNAAIWPQEYSISPQGYEIAFATNTAGPHLLLRALTAFNVIKPTGRVISLTGDIYVTLSGTENEDCSENFTYGSPSGQGGQDAYSRSKLGGMWLFDIMHGYFPQLQMFQVHPGVMDNTLSSEEVPIPKALLLSNEQGAQTTLICATADLSLLENGAYYHNVLGKLVLPARDPAKNTEKATLFWQKTEQIIAPYLRALSPEQPAAYNTHG